MSMARARRRKSEEAEIGEIVSSGRRRKAEGIVR